MPAEIPVTQARAAFAELVNRVGYGSERAVMTRHGKPLVALVSAADLRRLEELDAQDAPRPAEEPEWSGAVSEIHAVGPLAESERPRSRFGITARENPGRADGGRR
ncbi:type II toxin-antitoxin system Phd/YefM family antitoxin [Streptacidiphilus sp. MAP5-3]|uniref:type II toxin-antitoxin system Phd/YefM family antitoxin n=1 Tax=unclassified Streptacidiphilus TaxID=2643834 RepID=UPI0035192602